MAKFSVVLPAAGQSSRFKSEHYKKQFAILTNRAVWLHSAERFINRDDVVQVILVISEDDEEYFNFKFASNAKILGIDVVRGGACRADSVEAGLSKVRSDADFVCIHDAARPCLADQWINAIFEKVEKTDAVIYAIPVAGTLKLVDKGNKVLETVPRDGLWEAQTPQVFRSQLILDAYAQRNGFNATDESQLVERLGKKVTVLKGSAINFKITTKQDLHLAEQAIKALPKPKLQGPAHPFADDLWR